ncbi:unnamed protein product [marine sediment metagenome]|uniref:CARDB domain-containing protein n=1 Tax=marine sediment metagenome TaxID=412755 RepID=X0YJS3_9ZZZZ
MTKIIWIIIFLIILNFISIASVSALSVVVQIPEKYIDVMAGERFYFEIEVKYPENPSRKDLRLNYEILTQDGEIIAQSKVLKAIETQASFIDFIVIPESADSGLYIINVKISDYEGLSEEVGASFQIIKSDSEIKTYFFILLGAIGVVGLLVVWQIFKLRRLDK